MSIKIFTRTRHFKSNKTYIPKMYGVIEGPIRHESKRSLRPSAKDKKWVNLDTLKNKKNKD